MIVTGGCVVWSYPGQWTTCYIRAGMRVLVFRDHRLAYVCRIRP
jgi:hypothetical protein